MHGYSHQVRFIKNRSGCTEVPLGFPTKCPHPKFRGKSVEFKTFSVLDLEIKEYNSAPDFRAIHQMSFFFGFFKVGVSVFLIFLQKIPDYVCTICKLFNLICPLPCPLGLREIITEGTHRSPSVWPTHAKHWEVTLSPPQCPAPSLPKTQ